MFIRRCKGMTALETALMIPFLISLVIAAYDISVVMNAKHNTQKVAENVLRCLRTTDGTCVNSSSNTSPSTFNWTKLTGTNQYPVPLFDYSAEADYLERDTLTFSPHGPRYTNISFQTPIMGSLFPITQTAQLIQGVSPYFRRSDGFPTVADDATFGARYATVSGGHPHPVTSANCKVESGGSWTDTCSPSHPSWTNKDVTLDTLILPAWFSLNQTDCLIPGGDKNNPAPNHRCENLWPNWPNPFSGDRGQELIETRMVLRITGRMNTPTNTCGKVGIYYKYKDQNNQWVTPASLGVQGQNGNTSEYFSLGGQVAGDGQANFAVRGMPSTANDNNPQFPGYNHSENSTIGDMDLDDPDGFHADLKAFFGRKVRFHFEISTYQVNNPNDPSCSGSGAVSYTIQEISVWTPWYSQHLDRTKTCLVPAGQTPANTPACAGIIAPFNDITPTSNSGLQTSCGTVGAAAAFANWAASMAPANASTYYSVNAGNPQSCATGNYNPATNLACYAGNYGVSVSSDCPAPPAGAINISTSQTTVALPAITWNRGCISSTPLPSALSGETLGYQNAGTINWGTPTSVTNQYWGDPANHANDPEFACAVLKTNSYNEANSPSNSLLVGSQRRFCDSNDPIISTLPLPQQLSETVRSQLALLPGTPVRVMENPLEVVTYLPTVTALSSCDPQMEPIFVGQTSQSVGTTADAYPPPACQNLPATEICTSSLVQYGAPTTTTTISTEAIRQFGYDSFKAATPQSIDATNCSIQNDPNCTEVLPTRTESLPGNPGTSTVTVRHNVPVPFVGNIQVSTTLSSRNEDGLATSKN